MKIAFRSNYNTIGGRFLCYLLTIVPEENCRCGWKKPTRIVGGENTGVNEYPMMAGIVDLLYVHVFCGGSIISNKHVLTAAHCLRNRDADELAVLIGDHDLTTGRDANASLFRIYNYVLHPSFSLTKRNSDFDIAIITVTDIIQFTNEVGPACLPFQHNHDSFSGSLVELLGWGSTEFAGPTADILQKAKVSVINLSECVRSNPAITDHQLCTLTKGKDACQFDSGGPVLWQNPTTSRIVIVGIISHGIACGINIPSVNTRVGAFLDWIVSETQGSKYCQYE
ncbi:venom serine protease 34-like isoform X2 [Belonocnema kinseyi]|nr:venom serine protease 34-like isoform X2 [Belonocnema kinseyi]